MAQAGSKNIDNASGQVVRLDIENTLKTVATHNFGQRNQAGTIEPCEFLADSDTGKLLIRKSSGGDQADPNAATGTPAQFFEVGNLDTDNLGLLPKTGGTLTGVLQLPTGSVSAPALTVGDTGTGLFKPSSNVLGITAGGTKKLTLNSTATEFFGNATNGAKVRFSEASNNGSSYVELKAANSISNNLLLTLPTADGTSGQALLTNGSGTLSFGSPSVGADNLTGSTLASGVTASSLTSVGTLSTLVVSGNTSTGSTTSHDLSLTDSLTLSAGNANNKGLIFPQNIGGGTGDKAYIRYYVDGGGENTRLLIGIENDADDDIYLSGSLVHTSNNFSVNGTCTANSFSGDGSALTGINSLPQCVSTQLTSVFTNSDNPTPREQFQTVLSLSITPSSSSVKLLVMITGQIVFGSSGTSGSENSNAVFRCFEGTDAIGVQKECSRTGDRTLGQSIDQNILRTPNSTATKTYHLKIRSSDDDENVEMREGATITILEVS